MTHQALKQANYVHQHRDSYDRQGLVDAAVALGEWHLFSNRQIAEITGLDVRAVNGLTGKTDRTGGSFNPAALPDVIELAEARARGERGEKALVAALDGGVSLSMLARLTGAPKSTLARHAGAQAGRVNSDRPLAIWPHKIPDEQMGYIRQAKAKLDLPYRVVPSPAAPGSPGRILALGALPPWPHDHVALVKDPTNPKSIENALRWLLTAPEGATGGFGVTDYFSAFLGPVEDLGWIEAEQKVRFE